MIEQKGLLRLVRCYGEDVDRVMEMHLHVHTAGSAPIQNRFGDNFSESDIGVVDPYTFEILKDCELIVLDRGYCPKLYRKLASGKNQRMTNENLDDFSTRGAVKYLVYKR